MKNKEHLRRLFLTNNEENEVFTTSDGCNFWKNQHAVAHAATLKNKTVLVTTRAEAMATESDEEALAAIKSRMAAIEATVNSFKPEWEELEARRHEIEERIAASKETEAVVKTLNTDAPTGDQEEANKSAEGSGEPSGKNKKNKGNK